MPTDDLLSTTEAADLIGTERSNVSKMVRDGRLVPARKMPGPTGAYVFHRAEVERAAAEYQARPAASA
jgi:excisionase family DNA binding protein